MADVKALGHGRRHTDILIGPGAAARRPGAQLIARMIVRRESLTVHVITAVALLMSASAVRAQTSPWTLYVGAGHIKFNPRAEVQVAGSTVPGGGANASSNSGVAFGAVYAFSSDWSAELALGVPPTTTFTGAGTLASAGTLGRVTYGPTGLVLRRALPQLGAFQPYVGVGINYTVVFKSQDGFVNQLDVRNAFGAVAQAGLTLPLAGPWSVGLDVKKVWVRTTATGTLPALGGAPMRAEVRLDPLMTSLILRHTFN